MENTIAIVEIGSTNTKSYIYKENKLEENNLINIEFKKNYKIDNRLNEEDLQKLYNYINKIEAEKIFCLGTSIFRNLSSEELYKFINDLKKETNALFKVVTPEEENEYTVLSALDKVNYDKNIAVMIGGGGSTEISVVNNGKIIESCNSPYGVGNIMSDYPDLLEEYASSDINEIRDKVISNLTLPTNKVDVIVLAGGDHIISHKGANYPVKNNDIINSDRLEYIIDTKDKVAYDSEFYYKIKLNDMQKLTPDNPAWWDGSRAMMAFSSSIALHLEAKYIIPTKYNMIHGVLSKILNNELF